MLLIIVLKVGWEFSMRFCFYSFLIRLCSSCFIEVFSRLCRLYGTLQGEGAVGALYLSVATCYHHHDRRLHRRFLRLQWIYHGFQELQK